MPFSNENTTVEDNNVRLEGDSAMLKDNTAFDEGNDDLFTAGEDRFDDTSDDGLEQSQDDSSNNDYLYDSDNPICNNVEGEMEPVGGVDVGDVQCDDPIYNYPIAGENGIRSLDTLVDDSDQERGNAGISCTWVIAGVEMFSFQTITTEESTCVEDRLYKGRMFSSKAELKRALNILVIKEKFTIRVKRSCKVHYEVVCKDKACKFSVRATKLPDRGEYWQVRTFHKQLDIKKVIQNAYLEAHHGLCDYHLKKNFKNKFKGNDVCVLFTLARDYYKVADFNRHMNQIQQIHLGAHVDLMRIGPEKWARRWFHEQYEEAVKVTTPLSPWVARQLSKRFNDAHRFLVKPINRVEFEVKDGKMDGLVNLSRKMC
ncbi:Transposase [Theobroma cacao]|nr:Transposase [Theobroma cacao]